MFVPSDRYLKVDEDEVDNLKEDFGNDIISEESKYTFDNKMVEKYGEVLSKLILECDDIEEDDKKKIIKTTKNISIKKGTIDKMSEIGNVKEVYEAVRPIVSLKNVSIINS